jgi:predicted ester cyclase
LGSLDLALLRAARTVAHTPERDRAVARVRYTGTNKGDFMGMPATNKAVDVQLIDIFGFGADGRVREHWGVMDLMGMMQQLGLAPAGPSA